MAPDQVIAGDKGIFVALCELQALLATVSSHQVKPPLQILQLNEGLETRLPRERVCNGLHEADKRSRCSF